MKTKVTLELSNDSDDFVEIPLISDGVREVATVLLDGVFYHLERIKKKTLLSQYFVDRDADYKPQTDSDGYCYILSPFCK